ncbi:MAG: NAD(P)-dependent alcohol dehydrogenase, partial [Sulfitobacter sp.]|nr:NAD(P)-dependent alcohol dehydrogenase [Sulfitobacter sp.]
APQSEYMTALVHHRYGPFDQLQIAEIVRPTPGQGQVLIRVHAASLHAGDCMCVKGSPAVVRLATGLLRPKNPVPGFDVAGEVVAVGPGVTRFQVGDQVFGATEGACATYACAPESQLAHKPNPLTLHQAAGLPTSGLAALHGLRDAAGLQAGQRLLINGAAGGVGHFAIQIAKAMGAHVTGVCGPISSAMVREMGADEVIDYTKEDFAEGGPRFDVIFDNVENRSLADIRAALKPEGIYLANSGTGASGIRFIVRLIKPVLLSPFVGHTLKRYLSTPKAADLEVLKQYAEAGQLRPAIDRPGSLGQAVEALAHIDSGHAHGKVIVDLAGSLD